MPTFLFPLVALLVTMFASPVLAQWDHAPKDQGWLTGVAATLLAVLVLLANMKNAKRGHQD